MPLGSKPMPSIPFLEALCNAVAGSLHAPDVLDSFLLTGLFRSSFWIMLFSIAAPVCGLSNLS